MRRFITILSLFIALHTKAQDFTFSQFYEQPLLRNPALAGVFNGDLRVSMSYRDQWGAITVPFRTASLSIEHKTPVGKRDDFLTIGSQFSLDGAGDIRLKRTQLLPAMNFHKSLSEDKDSYLSVAFMGGPVFSQFDPTQLKFGDQYGSGGFDRNNPSGETIKNSGYHYWDISAGISYTTVFNNRLNLYFAGGIAHLNRPTIQSVLGSAKEAIAPRYGFNIGLNGKINDRDYITVFADYFTQNGNRQLIGGLLYGFASETGYYGGDPNIFYIGSFFRAGDAVIPVVKISFNHMTVGVSYDVNISRLRTVSNWRGGLELSVAYTNFLKIRNSTLDKVRCIRF
ncbi:MAG: PorP/SprF family type IX secretion system membrane protein [Sediminibacterium sp.]|nr:PorP/SprF family type IX secretion system membrane protein [Sediminibacterium sp.]